MKKVLMATVLMTILLLACGEAEPPVPTDASQLATLKIMYADLALHTRKVEERNQQLESIVRQAQVMVNEITKAPDFESVNAVLAKYGVVK